MIWYIAAFTAGWAACWYTSRLLLRHVLRRKDSLTAEVLSGLPQEKLLRVWEITDRELTLRRAVPVRDTGVTLDFVRGEVRRCICPAGEQGAVAGEDHASWCPARFQESGPE